MVTDAASEVVAEETDQAPPTEQTEAPVVETESAAAPPVEAAVEAPLTAAEFDRRWQERENTLRQQALQDAREIEQRRRQSEEGRRAAEAANRAQLRDAVSLSLVRSGITDLDDETADAIVDRVRGVETSIVAESTEAAINEAITAAAARAIGVDPGLLSPEAERYLPRFTSYMERLFAHEAVKQHISKDMRRAWEAELPKLVDAEISKRGIQSRSPEDLRRPDGESSGIDRSWEATVARIASGDFDQADEQMYRERRQGRV